MNRFSRQELLIGTNSQQILFSSRVIVFGIGGVGGHCCEMLARSGVGNIVLVDFDIIGKTNLNRQIVALESTIGLYKAEVMKERIMQINPNANVVSKCEKLCKENLESFFNTPYDYVIDCIDDVKAKVDLISYCYFNNIPCISAMGAGNRFGVPNFEVSDIYKTQNDRLARRLRKLLKVACIKKHLVVYSKQSLTKLQTNPVGSFAPYPAVCGCTLAGCVVTLLLEEK